MIVDVVITNNTLTVITDSGYRLEEPLNSLGAVALTCQRTSWDCPDARVAQKLQDAQLLIDKDIVNRFYSQTSQVNK